MVDCGSPEDLGASPLLGHNPEGFYMDYVEEGENTKFGAEKWPWLGTLPTSRRFTKSSCELGATVVGEVMLDQFNPLCLTLCCL